MPEGPAFFQTIKRLTTVNWGGTLDRAHILLLADEQMTDDEISFRLEVSKATVYRVRKNYHEGGLAHALHEKRRSGAPSKIDGRVEATLTMLACSDPPEGYGRWTLKLLADKLVELAIVETISLESVRTARKKTSSNPGWSNDGA
jgi:transposase